jgi:hypothetical protein
MISSNSTGSGGVFRSQADGVWFQHLSLLKQSTQRVEGEIDVDGLVLCPFDNQFMLYS